jgi:hypothetical protein
VDFGVGMDALSVPGSKRVSSSTSEVLHEYRGTAVTLVVYSVCVFRIQGNGSNASSVQCMCV